MDIAIVVAFLVFIGFREYHTQKHIKDLELKVLSKSPYEYGEYKRLEEKKDKPKIDLPKSEIVDALDVSSDAALKGLKGTDL